ncbi:MAG: sugar phosphate isomerase/epimerase family protein [Puniceicoccaceae bacterium]
MTRAFHQDIRIGTLAGKGTDTTDYIKSILPLGFESFQINFWESLQGVDLPTLADELKPVLEGSGAVISSISPFGNPLGEKPEDETLRQAWEQCIDHAHLFGTDLVTGFTGRVRGASIPDSIERYKEVFGPLAKRAADNGVRLAFENCAMGGNWLSGDWNIAHSPAAWELMFDALPEENIGLEWEPCHQMLLGIDPIAQLKTWLPKVFHVHGKDATLHQDVISAYGFSSDREVGDHRTPGFGDSNWTDIISILRKGGFTGSIDIEGWHDPVYKDELEMTGQVHALNYLKQCRGGDYVVI